MRIALYDKRGFFRELRLDSGRYHAQDERHEWDQESGSKIIRADRYGLSVRRGGILCERGPSLPVFEPLGDVCLN
jgi:hypothetical protein